MAKILLVSYYFPPSNSIACRRIYSWAEHLKQIGHEIIVLTAYIPEDHKLQNFKIDQSLLTIHYVNYTDLLIVIKKLLRIKESNNDDFEMINNNSKKSFRNLITRKKKNISRYFIKKGLLYGAARIPTFSDQWFFAAYQAGKRIIKEQNIEIIITSSPPPVVNLIGYRLKKRFREIKWIADFRDLWTQNPTHRGFPPFSLLELILEKKCMNKVDAITVVSDVWKGWLSEKYSKKKSNIYRIENGYDKELFNSSNSKLSSKNEQEKTIIYAGTLYENRRDPKLLFKVVNDNSLFLKGKIKIIFYGGPETKAVLDKNNVLYDKTKEIIEFNGYVSAEESKHTQQNADALLFIERDLDNDGTLPAKIYEYMLYEKPIICVGIDRGSYIGELMHKTGLCYFCGDDTQRIEEFFLKLLKDEIIVIPNHDYIQRFDRKNQVMKLNEIINKQLD